MALSGFGDCLFLLAAEEDVAVEDQHIGEDDMHVE